jgi:Family of unknown function (DUF5906)
MTGEIISADTIAKLRAKHSIKPKEDQTKINGGGPHDTDLDDMNVNYAVVRIGGKTRVMQLEESAMYPGCRVPVFSTIADFKAFHHNRKKTIKVDDRTKQVGIGEWWINQPDRRQYGSVVYAPSGTDSGSYNLWTGFACKPAKGGCGRYLDHLRTNVCRGDEHHFEYLLNWMAHAVQHPGQPGEVAVVMRGKEGVGKGVAAKQFGQLFGAHFRHVSQPSHLTGHFNAHLQQCSVLYADEAFFAGDRSHEAVLKAIITEEMVIIEPKGLDPYPVRNTIHLLMSSNSSWVVPAGAEARRYFVLDVADHHMQDGDYFSAITRQMDNDGRPALLDLLLNRDLSDFDVRKVPQTEALADQKAYSRRGIDRLIEHVAHEGLLPAAHLTYPNVAITSGEAEGNGFYPGARSLVPDLKHTNSIIISRELQEKWGCASWKGSHQRGLTFPPLAELRSMFDNKHGAQGWPPIDDWGSAT